MQLSIVVLCCLLCLSGCLPRQKITVANPVDSFTRTLFPDAGRPVRLVRVVADFNNDGCDDIAVTGSGKQDGGGGQWQLYLGSADNFIPVGRLRFDPRDSYRAPIERGATSIITFVYRSRGKYLCTEYFLKDMKLKERWSKVVAARERYAVLFPGHSNIFRDKVETCPLLAYARARNCLWRKDTLR